MDVEQQVATSCVTILTYPGSAPIVDRQDATIQIRVKSSSTQKAQETCQEMINVFDRNSKVCASIPGKVFADQSAPMLFQHLEGGEFTVSIADFSVKHIKQS